MYALWSRLRALFRSRVRHPIRVAAVQPLAAGVVMYAADIDGRRIVLAASPHAICVLDRYPCPRSVPLEEPPTSDA